MAPCIEAFEAQKHVKICIFEVWEDGEICDVRLVQVFARSSYKLRFPSLKLPGYLYGAEGLSTFETRKHVNVGVSKLCSGAKRDSNVCQSIIPVKTNTG